jgi:hypothetical protein
MLSLHSPSRFAQDPQRQRQALIAHRRSRSLSLGPCMWLQFEDALTVQHQVQEVLQDKGDPSEAARQREAGLYAHLLPDGRQWKATLLLGLPDSEPRARELPDLHEAARRLYVQLPKLPRVYAETNDALPRGASAVHFLCFEFPPPLRIALLAGAPASLGCDHDQYAYRRVIPMATLEQLRCDLAQLPHR